MTSDEKSSRRSASNANSNIESLAGLFHPHAIEVQEFSSYALILDVRSWSEFEIDHIPGAVQASPDVEGLERLTRSASNVTREVGVRAAVPLDRRLSRIPRESALLLYCGRGGLDSLPLAHELTREGWSVDVLPGGWINYRRWVQAGLEVLPRLIALRRITASIRSESIRVLQALRRVDHQVLDLGALAAQPPEAFAFSKSAKPAQAWFESQLLQALRKLDPRLPVWTASVGGSLGPITLPAKLAAALAIAPIAQVDVPLSSRVEQWRRDEPFVRGDASRIIQAMADLVPAPGGHLMACWRKLGLTSTDEVLASILRDHFDKLHAARVSESLEDARSLPGLCSSSFVPEVLDAAVRDWIAKVGDRAAPS